MGREVCDPLLLFYTDDFVVCLLEGHSEARTRSIFFFASGGPLLIFRIIYGTDHRENTVSVAFASVGKPT
jgi:hypothetical protein